MKWSARNRRCFIQFTTVLEGFHHCTGGGDSPLYWWASTTVLVGFHHCTGGYPSLYVLVGIRHSIRGYSPPYWWPSTTVLVGIHNSTGVYPPLYWWASTIVLVAIHHCTVGVSNHTVIAGYAPHCTVLRDNQHCIGRSSTLYTTGFSHFAFRQVYAFFCGY